jgi:hypothetical protein
LLSFLRIFPIFDSKCTFGCEGQTGFAPLTGKNNNNKTTSEEQMKFNKWTYGLAAVGAVSLASAARADEHPVNTMLSSTTLSGYVDVSAQYQNGQRIASPLGGANTTDGFSMNSITISLDKPLDESAWAAGYHIDLNGGNAASTDQSVINGLNTTTTAGNSIAIRQAYVALRTPLGNGIDWKFGAWDTILGYESATSYANPNFTRSYGWNLEATSYVGLLGTYKVADFLTINAGLANPVLWNTFVGNPGLSAKDFLASAVLTAPESFGAFKGATLTLGTAQSFQSGGVNNYYAGLTLPTPIKALALGFAFDALQQLGAPSGGSGYTFGAYVTYQATDKLGLAVRGEYVDVTGGANAEEITATLSYNLWANVVSRLELRWDHNEHGSTGFGGSAGGLTGAGYENNLMVALNVIYKF